MRKLTMTLIGALLSFSALGQDLLQCVNPDVVKGLLFYGRPEAQTSFTASLPEALADYTAPGGFALVGTSARLDGASTTVAYVTSLDAGAAYDSLLGSFEDRGWVIEEPVIPARQMFVIEGGGPPPASSTVCRDTERRYLSVKDSNGRRYATVGLNDQPNPRACNAEDPRQASLGRAMMSVLTDEVPTLTLPAGTTAADFSGRIGSSGGGSGDTYMTTTQIRITEPAPSVIDMLGAQMRADGWSVDSSWSGTLSHGGRWTRTSAAGILYWTTLELVDVGNELFDLRLQIMTPPL